MWVLARNLGEILREFGEILGKYRILDDSSLGSKGLNLSCTQKLGIWYIRMVIRLMVPSFTTELWT